MSEAGASPSTGITRLHQYCMAPSDFPHVRPLIETFGSLSRRMGSPLSPITPSPACCRHYPGGPDGCTHRSPSPSVGAFPELGAGRRPRLAFSRPARRLHVTACRIARPPTAAFVTRHRPGSCPPTAARQLPSPIDTGSCGLLLPLGSMIVSGHTPTYAVHQSESVQRGAFSGRQQTTRPTRVNRAAASLALAIPAFQLILRQRSEQVLV